MASQGLCLGVTEIIFILRTCEAPRFFYPSLFNFRLHFPFPPSLPLPSPHYSSPLKLILRTHFYNYSRSWTETWEPWPWGGDPQLPFLKHIVSVQNEKAIPPQTDEILKILLK